MNQNQRYQRNIMCSAMGEAGQEMMRKARVVVVGSGGLGGFVLQHLASLGIGFVRVIEFDTVSFSNLNRQILFKTSDIGKDKGMAAIEWIKNYNPDITTELFSQKLDKSNAIELIEGFDCVVDCTDNFEARYVMDWACEKLSMPLVHGAVEGYRGSVTLLHGEGGGSFVSLYGESLTTKGAVGVLSPIVGVVASAEAMEVFKVITNSPEKLYNKLLSIDILNNQYNIYNI